MKNKKNTTQKNSAKRIISASGLPGTIYLNKNRYWWKVLLPGEEKAKARPLKSAGSRFATTDCNVAVEVARMLWEQAIFATECQQTSDIRTIAGLVQAYLTYARGYYLDSEGGSTGEPQHMKYATRPLIELFGPLELDLFGPLKLKQVRERMIDLGWSRKVINKRISQIKRLFKWAVSEQVVSPVLLQGLESVAGLRRGRTRAKEMPRVLPADERDIRAVLPLMPKVVADMIQIQLHTGMRPCELTIMRPCDIDQSGPVWHYRPYRHKMQHLEDANIKRIISIGPKAQEIIRPYLLRPADKYCFSPAESEAKRRAVVSANRTVPLTYGNRPGTNKKEEPKRTAGDRYDTRSYGKAVRRAIAKANRQLKQEALNDGNEHQEIKWTLYQLRHTAATKVRKEFGYESAGAALGHTNMSATAIYAERNQGLADEAALKFG
ncbi:MAG: tyrosine-type recombinase/integrase [Phycisphaerae bacterium]|nr:tyrosine-type recombinase/integrase [Phycisphaerae bacterium]